MAGCPPFAPDTLVCGGSDRGVCDVVTQRCICSGGWSGKGDFVFGEPSCNLYLPAIRYLWIITCVLHFGVMLFSAEHVFRLIPKIRSMKMMISLQNSLSFGVSILIANVFIGITAALKAADPSRAIGTDVAVTVCFCIGGSAFYIGIFSAATLFVELNLKNARIRDATIREKFNGIVRRFRFANKIIGAFSTLWMVMPMVMLGVNSREAMYGLAVCHFVGAGLMQQIYGFIVIPRLISPLVHDIDGLNTSGFEGKDLEKLERFKARVNRVKTEGRNQGLVNGTLAYLFGFWPFLQSLSGYFLPFTWSCGAIALFILLIIGAPAQRHYLICCADAAIEDEDTSHREQNSTITGGSNPKGNRVLAVAGTTGSYEDVKTEVRTDVEAATSPAI